MSKPSTTNLTIAVNDHGNDTHIAKQHGMRYPDGTVRWTADKIAAGDYEMYFSDIAKGDAALQHWHDRLRKRAVAALIDPEEYVDNHVPLTRTIIVVITEAEVAR